MAETVANNGNVQIEIPFAAWTVPGVRSARVLLSAEKDVVEVDPEAPAGYDVLREAGPDFPGLSTASKIVGVVR